MKVMFSALGSAVYPFWIFAQSKKLKVQLNPLFPDFFALW